MTKMSSNCIFSGILYNGPKRLLSFVFIFDKLCLAGNVFYAIRRRQRLLRKMLEAVPCRQEADQSFSAYSVDSFYRRDLGNCVDPLGKEAE